MIKLCTNKNLNEIDKYIGTNYEKCLYLYLNYKKYGISNQNIKIYIQKINQKINALILKYYDCIHIYSQKLNCDYVELCELINALNSSVICAEKSIIKELDNRLNNKYIGEYGWIRKLKSNIVKEDADVQIATLKDFEDIAKLLYSDEDISSTYSIETLYNQIKERNFEKYGRNYIIKENNKIISHGGTGAESNEVAIINYVITREEYRGKGYAKRIMKSLCSDLLKEGKKIYLVNYTNESTRLYDKLGFQIVCECGKLFLSDKRG